MCQHDIFGRSYPSGGCASFNFWAKIDGMIDGQCQVYHIRVGYSNPTPHSPTGINEPELLFSILKLYFLESVSFKKCLIKLGFFFYIYI